MGVRIGPTHRVVPSLVEHAVNNDLLFDDFEIKAPIQGAKAVEGLAVTLDFTEAFIIEMLQIVFGDLEFIEDCLLYTSPSPRDRTRSRMPSSA